MASMPVVVASSAFPTALASPITRQKMPRFEQARTISPLSRLREPTDMTAASHLMDSVFFFFFYSTLSGSISLHWASEMKLMPYSKRFFFTNLRRSGP